MHPRILLILQNLTDHFLHVNVRPTGTLAHATTIPIGMRVVPEVILQFAILRVRLGEPVVLHAYGQRMLSQAPKLRAQIVSHDTVNYERPIDLPRCSEDFSTRQVPPRPRKKKPASLQPL